MTIVNFFFSIGEFFSNFFFDAHDRTRNIHHRILNDKYFEQNDSFKGFKTTSIAEKDIPKLDKYGYETYHSNHTLCQQAINLLMYSSDEEKHRKTILKKEVLNKLDNDFSSTNCLSIGVGNGDITMFISKYCAKLTVVDNSKESLANIPNYFGSKKTPVIKIEEDILDIQLLKEPENCYNSIDFLHAIYPIKNQLKLPLIDKLLDSLCSHGILTIAYNSGLKRAELSDTFNPLSNDLEGLAFKVLSNPKYDKFSPYGLTSTEIIKSSSIHPILLVAGLFLFDENITIDEPTLSSWLTYNAQEEDHYKLDSHQNFLFFEAE